MLSGGHLANSCMTFFPLAEFQSSFNGLPILRITEPRPLLAAADSICQGVFDAPGRMAHPLRKANGEECLEFLERTCRQYWL